MDKDLGSAKHWLLRSLGHGWVLKLAIRTGHFRRLGMNVSTGCSGANLEDVHW